MKDQFHLSEKANQDTEGPDTQSVAPEAAGKALANLLHKSSAEVQPKLAGEAEATTKTSPKKLFEQVFAKITGEQPEKPTQVDSPKATAKGSTRLEHSVTQKSEVKSVPKPAQQEADPFAGRPEASRQPDQEEFAEMSELDLDRHIEAQDQAIPTLKPTIPKPTPPHTDDTDDQLDDQTDNSPTPISTVLANKSFKTDNPPLSQSPVQLPVESPDDDDMALYKNYVKYGFIVAVIIIILAVLSFL